MTTTPCQFPEFVWIWNRVQNQQTPHLHYRMAKWLMENWHQGQRELLLLAFRDSGKSTLVGLFCAWLLRCHPDTRILVLAADHALAKKMVRNVKRIIERHPLTPGLKPTAIDQWASDQFTVCRPGELRDPSMLAKGIGANITGSRADVVICDDVEVPNTCDTPGKRQELRERLQEIDFVLTPGGLQLYVGTPHTFYTIYSDNTAAESGENQPFLAGFHRCTLAIVDAQGNSRWPERYPQSKIAALRRRSGPAKWSSQMMLRPTALTDSRLDPERLRPYDAELVFRQGNALARLDLAGQRLVSASCWWDPSFGAPQRGDASVIAAVYSAENGDAYIHRVAYLTHDPRRLAEEDEASQLCRQVAAFAAPLHLPAITVETNGLGRFLPGLLRRHLATARLPMAVVEHAARLPKDQRILAAFDARLAAGSLWLHQSVAATPLVREMREWRPGGSGADDGLDAVAGCLLAEPIRLPHTVRQETDSGHDWRRGGGVSVASEFAVFSDR